MRIECKTIPVEKAIRILRRKLDRDGRKERIKELEFYEKPTAKKKRMKAAAVKRQQKITNEFKKYTVRRPSYKRS
jgi:small subunit ribosomal protein S21